MPRLKSKLVPKRRSKYTVKYRVKKQYKQKIKYVKLSREELGKDLKPKKKFRRSRKIVRREAMEDMLQKYLTLGISENIVNLANMKWQFKYEIPTEKPDIQGVIITDYPIVEPNFEDL